MTMIKEKKLTDFYKIYPKAFDLEEAKKGSYWGFGFECGDGWYDIIEPIIKAVSEYNELNPNEAVYPSQVKEKFGTLRFYMTGYLDEIDKLIDIADEQSATTCEVCGKLGSTKGFRGWLSTTCPEHDRK
jgi:hypothetical protein